VVRKEKFIMRARQESMKCGKVVGKKPDDKGRKTGRPRGGGGENDFVMMRCPGWINNNKEVKVRNRGGLKTHSRKLGNEQGVFRGNER